SEFRASEWRACVLLYAKRFGPGRLYEFCLKIEKVYLAQWVKGVRKDERYGDYSKILGTIQGAANPDNVMAAMKYDEKSIKDAAAISNLYKAGFGKYFLLRLELVTSEHDNVR